MRSTVIRDLSSYPTDMIVWDIQDMNFKEGDDCPFWSSMDKKASTKFDKIIRLSMQT